MRFPSIRMAATAAAATARRFPWTLVAAVTAMTATMAMIAAIGKSDDSRTLRLLAVAVLGLSTLTAVTIAAERAGLSRTRRRILETLVAAALGALFLVSIRWPDAAAPLRFAQLLVAAHLLVAVLPYYKPGPLGGFWQFNRFLFARFLLATLYSSVLWGGLAIALGAIDKLLGVSVPSNSYGYLWAVMAFLFHPWFMLSGIPSDYQQLERLEDYPFGIKIFTQFVLIPLVTVYLAILLLYLGRVIITRTWPSGWIGYLVSSVSVVGVLALLLVHPLRERADSKWIDGYGRWFFVALLAPLVMLLMAIGKRIGQHGVTEPRYFLLMLGLWGLAIAVFYALTASRNIKVIPMTLAALALLTAFGPWGAYQVSLHNQLGRLERIVIADGMGRLGALTPATRPVSVDDRKEISGIFDYLYSRHGAGALAAAIGVPSVTVRAFTQDSVGRSTTIPEGAMRRLGLSYVAPSEGRNGRTFYFSVKQPEMIDVAGFEQMQSFALWPQGKLAIATDSLTLVADSTLRSLALVRGTDTLMTVDVVGALQERGLLADSIVGAPSSLDAPVVIHGERGGLAIALVLTTGGGSHVGTRITISNISGYVLLRGVK